MGLQPLEFADCLTDSPFFRDKLHTHEKELERTSKNIKTLINDGKELLSAAKNLSKAQKTFSQDLIDFKFECIGNQQTDDELLISGALKEFGCLIQRIEEERDRMLEKATEEFIRPLESFRKDNIGLSKDGKKKFEKQTNKFCQSLERYLNLKSAKVTDKELQDADAVVEFERRQFYEASMAYVLILQEVQERKKFDFVEILLRFLYSWMTFYHQGHEIAKEFKAGASDLQLTLQKTRDNFDSTKEKAEQLMNKMLDARGTKPEQTGTVKGFTRQGYLYLMEKKALGTTWSKVYAQYKKDSKEIFMMPYNQVGGKLNTIDRMILTSCIRRATDSIDKRFCFDITVNDKPTPFTLQALSDEDRLLWLDAMDGKEPIYNVPHTKTADDSLLDDIGFNFIKKCIAAIEGRGLFEQGLYRVVGVTSKVNKLTSMGLDRRKIDKLNLLDDSTEWDLKTVTSAVKNYLRNLPEPLMTFRLHDLFIAAAKKESKTLRIHDIHTLVHKLPEPNYEMLDLLVGHLQRVAAECGTNSMTISNLGVCFGPTLMRPEEETVAAIMDIKFCNIVIEILIGNYDKIFKTPPEDADISEVRVVQTAKKFGMHSENTTPNHHPQNRPSSNLMSTSYPNYPGNNQMTAFRPVQKPTKNTTSAIYMNQAPVHSNITQSHPSQARNKLRPVQVFNPLTGGLETQSNSSNSGSTESLNSSNRLNNSYTSSPAQHSDHRSSHNMPVYSNLTKEGNKYTLNITGGEPPTFGSVKKRTSTDSNASMSSSMHSNMGDSLVSLSSNSSSKPRKRKVRTIYACRAENNAELSFEPNQIINNVRPSREPGWLEGTLNGKSGLVPENYVEYID